MRLELENANIGLVKGGWHLWNSTALLTNDTRLFLCFW
jgi:hypothetical protein